MLPRCGVILSSRSHASVSLRQQATVRVDILGFTEAERERYIKESMKGQSQKIDELTQYLQGHSTISSLCFVPFNLVVLAYLYKQGFTLPKNSAELYNYFICLTVCRHLAKHGHCLQGNITKLTDLPEPYNKIIQQLSKLSLEALNDDKLIFTFEEIKEAYPDITAILGAINGCGLLQAVEHFDFTGTTMTINFLHFSIQEYLAAHYIANLPDDKELKIIEEKFQSDIHLTCSPYTCHSQKDSGLLSNIFFAVEAKHLLFLTNSSIINYNVSVSTTVSMKLVMLIFARL